MAIPISTLDGARVYDLRKCGNTTRLINSAIDLLFTGHEILVHDHYERGGNKQANNFLFRKILDRLAFEHKITTKNTDPIYAEINSSILIIKLVGI